VSLSDDGSSQPCELVSSSTMTKLNSDWECRVGDGGLSMYPRKKVSRCELVVVVWKTDNSIGYYSYVLTRLNLRFTIDESNYLEATQFKFLVND
jgi:hypothetical protein